MSKSQTSLPQFVDLRESQEDYLGCIIKTITFQYPSSDSDLIGQKNLHFKQLLVKIPMRGTLGPHFKMYCSNLKLTHLWLLLIEIISYCPLKAISTTSLGSPCTDKGQAFICHVKKLRKIFLKKNSKENCSHCPKIYPSDKFFCKNLNWYYGYICVDFPEHSRVRLNVLWNNHKSI